MKSIILALMVLVASGQAWGQEQLAFCSNMQGVSLELGAGTPQFEPDGFSGTDYVVAIRDNTARVLKKRGSYFGGVFGCNFTISAIEKIPSLLDDFDCIKFPAVGERHAISIGDELRVHLVGDIYPGRHQRPIPVVIVAMKHALD